MRALTAPGGFTYQPQDEQSPPPVHFPTPALMPIDSISWSPPGIGCGAMHGRIRSVIHTTGTLLGCTIRKHAARRTRLPIDLTNEPRGELRELAKNEVTGLRRWCLSPAMSGSERGRQRVWGVPSVESFLVFSRSRWRPFDVTAVLSLWSFATCSTRRQPARSVLGAICAYVIAGGALGRINVITYRSCSRCIASTRRSLPFRDGLSRITSSRSC